MTENVPVRLQPGRFRAVEGSCVLDTVYSLSADLPLLEDGSDADEDPSALEPGALVLGSIRQVCLIRKISAGGALLHVDMPMQEGERLDLELGTGEHLDGTVEWVRGAEIGLRFDEAIDILPILARNLVSQPGERRRMPRVELACAARLEVGRRTMLVTVRDISQGGAKIETAHPLQPGEPVLLTPEDLCSIQGKVQWVRGGRAGIAFHPELGWQDLMPWLKARQSAPAADFIPAAPPPAIDDEWPAEPMPPSSPDSLQLNLPARVREGTRRWAIDVSSLTARTVEFDSYAPLRLGTLLWIVLPGLEGWPARIVAVDGYRFTCEFTQPLHPAVLDRILASTGGE